MLWFFTWLISMVLVGVTAHTRNRSVWKWVLASLFISPFFAFLFILVLGKKG